MKTKTSLLLIVIGGISFAAVSLAFAQGTAFTYQGQLTTATGPANGMYDMTFALWNAATGGSQVGSTITDSGLNVTNGAVTVLLDFGGVFDGTTYWLELAARTNGAASYTALSPRQELTPVPYAIYSENAGTAVTANAVINGAVSAPQLNTLGAPTSGQILGFNGTSLTWMSPSAIALDWSLTGNAGTSPTSGNFLGTTDNQPLDVRVNNQRALRLLPTNPDPTHSRIINILGGSELNYLPPSGTAVQVYGATISGGGGLYNGQTISNTIWSDFGTIGGGGSNACIAPFATVGGGQGNTASGDHATVVGGWGNIASGRNSTALGGFSRASGDYSLAGGGANAGGTLATAFGSSSASGNAATATGSSTASGQNSVALGIATANGDYSAAFGDATAGATYSTAFASGEAYGYASIAGGIGNIVYGDYSLAMGLYSTAFGVCSTVIGSNSITDGNYSTVSGGARDNAVGDFSTVGGGFWNSAVGILSTVGGGNYNFAYGWADTIAGGEENIARGGTNGGFGPGSGFIIDGAATVGGGFANQAIGYEVTVGGGYGNMAFGYGCTVGGGFQNRAGYSVFSPTNYADFATVAGGTYNVASGLRSTVCGGQFNLASGYASFAAGNYAQATHNNSFVWNGFSGTASSFRPGRLHVYGTNGLSVDYYGQRPDGGGMRWVVIGDGGSQFPGQTISTWTGAYLTDSGTWQNASDRNRKTDLEPIEPSAILEKLAALPVASWRYTNEVAGVRHIGPMAQDFMASFGLGTDEKTISTVDEGGVALAAIQALNQKLNDRDAEIQQLQQAVAQLKEAMARMAVRQEN
jgi:hypothetical protein